MTGLLVVPACLVVTPAAHARLLSDLVANAAGANGSLSFAGVVFNDFQISGLLPAPFPNPPAPGIGNGADIDVSVSAGATSSQLVLSFSALQPFVVSSTSTDYLRNLTFHASTGPALTLSHVELGTPGMTVTGAESGFAGLYSVVPNGVSTTFATLASEQVTPLGLAGLSGSSLPTAGASSTFAAEWMLSGPHGGSGKSPQPSVGGRFNTMQLTYTVTAVPEPGMASLFGVGLVMLLGLGRGLRRHHLG